MDIYNIYCYIDKYSIIFLEITQQNGDSFFLISHRMSVYFLTHKYFFVIFK